MQLVKKISLSTNPFIENSDALLNIYRKAINEIPVVTEAKNKKNRCYVTSFKTQYILYTREEVLKSSKYSIQQKRLVKYISPFLLPIANLFLKQDILWVNNNLTSTPLYNKNWQLYDIKKLTNQFLAHYPKQVIIYKCVEPQTNPVLFRKFIDEGYISLLGRQVYIFDPKSSNYKKKRSYQMDKKLAEKQDRFYWTDLDMENHQDVQRVLELYKRLYLEKHSIYNPIYTEAFVKDGIGNFRLRFEVLKDRENKKIVAVQGIYETDKVINTSFIGYDQSLPQKLGLYRLMNYELMRQAIVKEKILNMSSGAGDFKLKRGGQTSFEYQMIYPGNLSLLQRKIWKFLAKTLEKTAKQHMKDLKV